MFCINCGTKLDQSGKCSNCGAQYDMTPSAGPVRPVAVPPPSAAAGNNAPLQRTAAPAPQEDRSAARPAAANGQPSPTAQTRATQGQPSSPPRPAQPSPRVAGGNRQAAGENTGGTNPSRTIPPSMQARRKTANQTGAAGRTTQARPAHSAVPAAPQAARAPVSPAVPVSRGKQAAANVEQKWFAWGMAVPALLFLTCLLGYPLLVTALISIKDYNPIFGLIGSEYVGTQHFQMFFMSPDFTRILNNSLIYGILSAVLGGALVFGASYGVAHIKNAWLKCGVLSALLLPALLPSALVAASLLPQSWLQDPALYRFGPLLNELFCIAPIVVLAGAFVSKRVPPLRRALLPAVCYACLRVILLLSCDFSYILMTYSPLVYESADTFDSFAFRKGLQEFNSSFSAAVTYVKLALQLLPAVIGTAVLILFVNRSKQKEHKLGGSTAGVLPAVVLGAVCLFLGVSMFLAFFSQYELVNNGLHFEIAGRSFVLSIGGWFFAAIVALGLSCVMSNGGKLGRAMMLCIAAALLLALSNDIGRYIAAYTGALKRSSFGVIIQYGSFGVFGAYLLFIAAEGRRDVPLKKWFHIILAPAVALSGVLFAKLFGDVVYNGLMYGNMKGEAFATILRNVASQPLVPGTGELRTSFCICLYSLVPVLVGFVCIWAGGVLENRAARNYGE